MIPERRARTTYYIPPEIWEEHGDRYRVVGLDGRVALIPLADDPVEGLREAVDDAFDGKSIAVIKRETREATLEDATNGEGDSDR